MLSDSERRTVQELESALLSDRAFSRAVLPVVRRLGKPRAPVVVGVPADGGSAPAVEWAAAEAAGRRRPLRIVHAFSSSMPVDPLGVIPVVDNLAAQQAAAARLVDAALARVRSIAPGVEVSAVVVQGPPRRVLLRESRDASLLVLGPRRRGGVRRLLHGSLTLGVAASAACPVAVVHPSGDVASDPVAPRVVVGVDGLPHSDAALGFAFRAAAQRGAAVTAVHAWAADCAADLEAVTAPLVTTEAAAYALVDGAVGAWRDRYPDVPVLPEVVRRDPASALVTGSAGAALVVVGSRGRRAGLGAVFGSVSRAVVDGAAAPVAVVRRGTEPFAAEAHPWAPR
ncbi:Nucleotide-binding universal stress protein, UspA family [Geodermatophilus obscurus]|uniref:Nucleotide-binding universal stress protein, UspA family n=1 Tax=Geodermatophilus obscurus TaxID=1861 RepID=A0A1M7T7D9_9ACTN|nr:universal stress protein [Geodermatophilus obscurus]SHN66587.1 Nucleotide-binding universal stress protein, UspA family [Geodermatophilus obscurus]